MATKKVKETKKAEFSLELGVMSTKGKEVEKINLDPSVFDGKVNHALMQQAVVTYLANQRKGLACAKTRGQVRGGGKKPWRQKGTGRARVGSSRSPLWRGGGVTFGPKPHSFTKDFPKKMKIAALKSALNAKLKDDEILILEELRMDTSKTKDFMKVIQKLKIVDQKIRLVLSSMDANIKLASRNVNKVQIQEAKSLTTYEALNCKKLVFAKAALEEVQTRVKGKTR
ncbi:MAG: 50S ribosomal protein L4 [Candidatus Omnitrophica bacterium]|nr:50S ribosomal protein L4 [Candidatus Omnitrophota bacterium]